MNFNFAASGDNPDPGRWATETLIRATGKSVGPGLNPRRKRILKRGKRIAPWQRRRA